MTIAGIDRHDDEAETVGETHDRNAGESAEQTADRRNDRRGLTRDFERFEHLRAPGRAEEDASRADAVAKPDERGEEAETANEKVAELEVGPVDAFVTQEDLVIRVDVDPGGRAGAGS